MFRGSVMSEVERSPSSTLSRERRYGIAISIALILGGGWWALTDLTAGIRTSEVHYPIQGTSLVIDAGAADLEIRSADVREITVTGRTERNVFGSDPAQKYENGRLELDDTGCGFLSFACDTGYVIVVPTDLPVRAETKSGDLKASDLPGGADLKSSSGDVEASAIGGDLRLESSSGDLEASTLGAAGVVAKTRSGDVDLTFDAAPSSVQAESRSGDVAIEVPSGGDVYRVDTDTSSGDQSTTVTTDPASPRSITAKSSSGDVSVEYAGN
jgi:DUF4097 and DUF4098 domain-containing protein YvlB